MVFSTNPVCIFFKGKNLYKLKKYICIIYFEKRTSRGEFLVRRLADGLLDQLRVRVRRLALVLHVLQALQI